MLDAAPSLIARERRGPLRALTSKLLGIYYTISGKDRYDNYRLERVVDLVILVMPTVANPKLLRTGAFFATEIAAMPLAAGTRVLDLGTGSGVCALAAARRGAHVVGVDINRAAVRCAGINATLNHLEAQVEWRHGDLFAPVSGRQFDLVLFNPPFIVGPPRDSRDAAWRSTDAAARFAADLGAHLAPGGSALLLLSSFGDACSLFEQELHRRGFGLALFARRRFVNEIVSILRVTRPAQKLS